MNKLISHIKSISARMKSVQFVTLSILTFFLVVSLNQYY